jgi:hypothetical protein
MIALDLLSISDSVETLAYFLLAILHVVNAYMYLWMWSGEHQNIFSIFCIPDWLNVICAAFYIGTSICHPFEYDEFGNTTEIFVQVRRIELFLSVLEILTAVGYVCQWYLEFRKDLILHPDKCRTRGCTLDDPDMWANITLIIAAIYYFAYNVIVCIDGFRYYDTSTLYFQGDLWYLVNSICYLLCSLRDWDVFWFMPTGGQFPNYNLLASEYVRSMDEMESQSADVYRDICLQGLTGEVDVGRSQTSSTSASALLGSNGLIQPYSVDGMESSFDPDIEMGGRPRSYSSSSSGSIAYSSSHVYRGNSIASSSISSSLESRVSNSTVSSRSYSSRSVASASEARYLIDAQRMDGQDCPNDDELLYDADDRMADVAPLLSRKTAKGS